MFENELRLLFWFLKPLLLTILVESGIAFLCGVREFRFYRAMLWINAITNPLLCFFVFFLYRYDVPMIQEIIFFCEIGIILVEWRLLLYVFPRQKQKMFLLSLAMNGGSYLFGMLFQVLL